MVYLHFPSQFTEEEEMLQKKYQKLKRKKKALQQLKTPKQDPPPPKPTKLSMEAKPDAKEVAKKLLKSGAISAIKVENKERQGFKRPKGLERKRGCEKSTGSVAGYQPFTASHSLEDEPPNNESETTNVVVNRPIMKKLYKSFVSSRENEGETKDDRRERDRDRDGRPERPRQGNTVYVRGYGVTKEILQEAFDPYGNIKDISMEMDKNCGFVSFEKIENAEQAIKEMNGVTASGIQLSVSLARNQPMIPTVTDDSSSSASWASLAVNFPQKGRHEDKRDLVSYDDYL